MVECPKCLGVAFCHRSDPLPHPLTPPPLSWLDICVSNFGSQATEYNYVVKKSLVIASMVLPREDDLL